MSNTIHTNTSTGSSKQFYLCFSTQPCLWQSYSNILTGWPFEPLFHPVTLTVPTGQEVPLFLFSSQSCSFIHNSLLKELPTLRHYLPSFSSHKKKGKKERVSKHTGDVFVLPATGERGSGHGSEQQSGAQAQQAPLCASQWASVMAPPGGWDASPRLARYQGTETEPVLPPEYTPSPPLSPFLHLSTLAGLGNTERPLQRASGLCLQ